MTWFPIETCPKDGTEFLAYDSATDKMDVCTWDSHLGLLPSQSDGEYGPLPDEFGYDDRTVRHWQPLPARPCADEVAA